MKTLTKIIGIAGLMAMSGVSNAASVGGVNWDPNYQFDFSQFSMYIHQNLDPATGAASGYGLIGNINDTTASVFCSGCELSFTFGGFTPIGSTMLPNNGTAISYAGGNINFYVDYSPEIVSFATLSFANAGSESGANQLWLSLIGHALPDGSSFTGTANGSGTQLTGSGLLDVVGGLAASFVNTNTMDDGNGGWADLAFTTSFTNMLGGANNPLTPYNERLLSANGTGNLQGDSVSVPEPASLALLGIGIVGFASFRRNSSIRA